MINALQSTPHRGHQVRALPDVIRAMSGGSSDATSTRGFDVQLYARPRVHHVSMPFERFVG